MKASTTSQLRLPSQNKAPSSGGRDTWTSQLEPIEGYADIDRREKEGRLSHQNGNGCCSNPLKVAFKVVTVTLAILMVASAIEAGIHSKATNVGIKFVCSYQIFFGSLLLAFETVQLNSNIDYVLQRNVGFLYTLLGKPLFIIFVAFLSFGLQTQLGLISGITLLCYGTIQIVLFLKYPEILESVSYERAPSKDLEGSVSIN